MTSPELLSIYIEVRGKSVHSLFTFACIAYDLLGSDLSSFHTNNTTQK